MFDLGSSSFHLMVVDAGRDNLLTPVLRRRSLLHLGTDVAEHGVVPPERAALAVRTLRRLHGFALRAEPDVVVAMATAALRDAGNGARLLERFERVLGVPIVLLSGEEEARLCLTGQRSGVWVGSDPVLGLDLGGGSLEAGVCDSDTIYGVASVALGTARLRGELGIGGLLVAGLRDSLENLVDERLEPLRSLLRAHPSPVRRVIASGGTVRSLARLAMHLHRPASATLLGTQLSVNQVELPTGQVVELADRLAVLSLEERLELPGMQARRAPLLPIGAVVLARLLVDAGLDRIVVSEWGLREGAVMSALGLEAGTR